MVERQRGRVTTWIGDRPVTGMGMVVRLALAVTVGTAVVAAGYFLWSIFAVQSRIGHVSSDYFEAIADGDGVRAYELLCEPAQRRTSPEELAHLAEQQGGIEVLSGSLRGTGPATLWPWDSDGRAGVRLRIKGQENTRYVDAHRSGDWTICPTPAESWIG
jgi:hypothetical protein